jgi:hypothetical protein
MDGAMISPFMRAILTTDKDGDVVAPDNIIMTVAAAYQQYTAVRNDHLDRILVYAAIDGMLSGNPPYDQKELEENGLGHIANFNTFKARSSYEKAAQGYWNLINSTEVFVKIILAGKHPKYSEYAELMARHFSDMVKQWQDFAPNFNLLGAQLTKFGICPVIFPHEQSPIWEVVDVSRFYIPSQTQTFLSKLSNACVDTTYTVQELYMIYKKSEKVNTHWNREALGQFLIYRANAITQNTNPFQTAVDLERFVANNDANVNKYFNDTVRLVNMYQKEYDGKISHYIFSADMFNTTNGSNIITTQDFMYFFDRQYTTFEDALVVFTASPGEWTVHGNMGLGQKMFAPAQAINMLDCSIVDMSRMSATPLVRTLATGGRDSAQIRFYPGVVTDIGAAEFAQNNLGANINQLVGASQYLNQGLEMNAINSGDDPSMPDRSQGSIAPSQARAQSFKEFGVLKNVVAHFYNTFDVIIRNTFVRFLTMKEGAPGWELAKEFKERCLEDGVPEVLFDTAKIGLNGLPRQFRSVAAARVAGDGSTLARIMGLESLDRIVPMFNPRELSAYKKEWVASVMGIDYIPTFASSDDQGDELSGGASLARTEDNLMKLGQAPLFSADNDQAAHLDEHMGTATEIVKAVSQQQMSPVDADKMFALMIPHIGEHLQFVSGAPQFYQEIINKIDKPFKQLVQWAQLNRRNAEAMIQAAMKKQAEDQAATQEVMDDAQRKDFVAQKDAERADFKVQQQVERAKEANVTRGEVMKEKVRKDADIKRMKVELEADVKQQATAKGRTQAELENTPLDDLSGQLASMTGSTPSNVDFEG